MEDADAIRKAIYHRPSGPRLATVWLRKRSAGLHDYEPVRVARSIRFFKGDCPHEEHRNGMDPAVDEALEYIERVDQKVFDSYEIVVWTPQRYSCGGIGELEQR